MLVESKVTSNYRKITWNLKGRLITPQFPLVMGIINCTPDSFYPGSRFSYERAIEEGGKMLEDGANIIDVGGYSTRPGADKISRLEELERVLPVIEGLSKHFPKAMISIDSFRSQVVHEAIQAGASIINDVSGGQLDPDMYSTAASLRCPYVVMHMRGNPQTMTELTAYDSLIFEIIDYFVLKMRKLRDYGVMDVIIDPGFGFAKNSDQNYNLLKKLQFFKQLGVPLLVGLSRKSMIYRTLDTTPDQALHGTTALHMAALLNGADILRTHDVQAAVDTVKVYKELARDTGI